MKTLIATLIATAVSAVAIAPASAAPVDKDGWTGSADGRVITYEGGPLAPDVEDTFAVTFTAPASTGGAAISASGYTATVLPRDRQAWARLCRLLTVGRLRVPKGECELRPQDLIDWGQGMEMLIHPPGRGQRPAWEGITRRLTDARNWTASNLLFR